MGNQECKYDFRTKLVGDGCQHCNPQYYIAMLEEQIKEGDALLKEMAEALNAYDDYLCGLPTLGIYGLAVLENGRTVMQKYSEQRESDGPTRCYRQKYLLRMALNA